MKPTNASSLGKAFRESGVALGILVLPISAAFNPVNFWVLFVTGVSVIIYIASKRVFETSEEEHRPEESLDRAGRLFSAAAITVCFAFSIFLLAQGDLRKTVAATVGDVLKAEVQMERSAGRVQVLDVNQLPEPIRKLDATFGFVDNNNVIYAPTSSVISSVSAEVFDSLQTFMRYLFYYTIIVSALVFSITWVGKSFIRPLLATLQAANRSTQ
jgi:hypothetical protein